MLESCPNITSVNFLGCDGYGDHVEKAVEYKLGARGLRSICEAVLSDAMFELPGKEGVEQLRVTADYARKRFDASDKGQLKVAS